MTRQICIKNRKYIYVNRDSSETIIKAVYGSIGFNKEFTVKDIVPLIPDKSVNTLSHNLRQMAQRNLLRSHLLHPRCRIYSMQAVNINGQYSKAFRILQNK